MLIFSHYWGVDGVWWAFSTTDAATAVVIIVMLIPQLRNFRRKARRTETGEGYTVKEWETFETVE